MSQRQSGFLAYKGLKGQLQTLGLGWAAFLWVLTGFRAPHKVIGTSLLTSNRIPDFT